MTTQEIVSKLWNLCNVLRDDGITYHQYVTELTYILFLKMAKETGTEEQIPEKYRCQHLAAANTHHHRCAATDHAVLLRHGLDGLGQGFFRVLLQVDVQGQGHGTAGLRFLGIELAGDLALLIGGDDAGTC